MINNFYKDFKIKDYMDEEGLKEQSLDNYLDCSLGVNDFINEDIIKKHISNCNYEINKYPSKEYILLKEELIKYWKVYNNDISIKNISFGSGVMGSLRNISEILFDENTLVLGCAPQFPRFISEVELKKAKYDYYSFEDKFNVDDFINKMSKEHNIICIENPNNPTGQIIDIKDIEKIIINAKNNDSIVIIDEAYGDYMDNSNSAITLIGKYDNFIVIRSASKFYGLPNHRVGYLFASEEFIKIYNEITIPFPFSDISAYVFRKVLEDHKEFDLTKEKIYEIKKNILESLNKDNYLYTDLKTPIFTIKSDKYDNLSKVLKENGILSENCSIFTNLDSRYARIKIPKEWGKLLSTLERIL